jgi:hypothetical protein
MSYEFRQLTGNSKYRSWKEWAKDDFIIGEVERFEPNRKNPKFQDIVIKVKQVGFKAATDVAVGDMFSINGNTGIQKAIDMGIEENDIIKVTYGGQATVKNGQWAGTKTHVTSVEVAGTTRPATAPASKPSDDNGLL